MSYVDTLMLVLDDAVAALDAEAQAALDEARTVDDAALGASRAASGVFQAYIRQFDPILEDEIFARDAGNVLALAIERAEILSTGLFCAVRVGIERAQENDIAAAELACTAVRTLAEIVTEQGSAVGVALVTLGAVITRLSSPLDDLEERYRGLADRAGEAWQRLASPVLPSLVVKTSATIASTRKAAPREEGLAAVASLAETHPEVAAALACHRTRGR